MGGHLNPRPTICNELICWAIKNSVPRALCDPNPLQPKASCSNKLSKLSFIIYQHTNVNQHKINNTISIFRIRYLDTRSILEVTTARATLIGFRKIAQLAMLLSVNLESIRSGDWGSKGALLQDPFKSFVQKGGTQKIQEQWQWWDGGCMACIQPTPHAPPSSWGRLLYRHQHQLWNSRASSQDSRSSQKRTHRKTRSAGGVCCPQL